jgi:hypothetical protein
MKGQNFPRGFIGNPPRHSQKNILDRENPKWEGVEDHQKWHVGTISDPVHSKGRSIYRMGKTQGKGRPSQMNLLLLGPPLPFNQIMSCFWGNLRGLFKRFDCMWESLIIFSALNTVAQLTHNKDRNLGQRCAALVYDIS